MLFVFLLCLSVHGRLDSGQFRPRLPHEGARYDDPQTIEEHKVKPEVQRMASLTVTEVLHYLKQFADWWLRNKKDPLLLLAKKQYGLAVHGNL